MSKLEQTLKELVGPLVQAETGRSLIFTCPTCQREKLYVDKRNGDSICFYCSRGFKTHEIVAQLLGITFDQAMQALYDTDTAAVNSQQNVTLLSEIEEIFGQNISSRALNDSDFSTDKTFGEVKLDWTFVPLAGNEDAIAYLQKRGVTSEKQWETFGLQYHKLMKGIVFPVVFKGTLVGWQCRLLTPDENGLRMRSSPGLPKAEILMNYDEAIKQPNIVLVEGPFDCVKAHQPDYGFGAVASFGKGVSAEQIQLLINSPAENIYLGLDRDAVKEVERLCQALCPHKMVYRVFPPSHREDLGDCTDQEAVTALKEGVRYYAEKQHQLEIFMR